MMNETILSTKLNYRLIDLLENKEALCGA